MSLLEIDNLSIQFGGVSALSSFSLKVEPNTFVGLMGPNGAGKTTLINCISRILSPSAGRIVFEGHDLLKLKGDEISKLGISRTFQDLNFLNSVSDMLVIDYVRLGQFSHLPGSLLKDGLQIGNAKSNERELKKNARRILEFFADIREKLEAPQEERGYPAIYGREGFPDLIDVEYRQIGILSFAWRRRLDLARALVSQPKFLLLDEPAQGLPPSEIENLGKTLKLIQSEFGVSALIVEHNVTTLMEISDSIVVMNYGKKLAEGLPEEIRNNQEVIEIYLGKATPVPDNQVQVAQSQLSDNSGTKIRSASLRANASVIPLLDVKNIDLFYGQAQALSSVSLKLFPNEVSCVLGTNGSGKSSLLKAVSGSEIPATGEILLKGEYLPLGRPEVAAERGIQYVPQGHVLFPRLTVHENLRIGAFIEEVRGRKPDFDGAYHFFPQLRDLSDKLAIDLSGGQQQMLAILQALMAKPEVLLLDEPSLGLAPRFVEQIFDLIRRISVEGGCSILLVEQSVSKSLQVSDYVYMMSAGVLVGEGSKEIFAKDDSLIRKNLGFY
jgi:branched-chain amino acid transport system ATP-binding protein